MAENVGGIYYDVTLETGAMIDGSRQVEKVNQRTALSFNAITLAIKALAAAYAALKFADIADEWGQFDSRMKMATRSAEEHAHAQRRMRESANETFRAINETREAFIRMSPVLRDMGLTLDQSIDAIDAFSGLLVVNAASAERGSSAMDALSKSMQKGRIDADAWATISATMPSIVDLLAKNTGMAADEIRRLGVEGKLSVNDLTATLVQGNAEIMEQVRQMPTTFRDAVQNLTNGLTEYIGQVNRASQFSAILTSVVNGAGDVMAELATQITEANDAADELGGNTAVFDWANATRTVLSYVADAADLVTRGFRQMGTALGGLAASATMAAQGELRQAADTLKATWADIQAIGNAPYSGARMRENFASGGGGGAARAAEPLNLRPGPAGAEAAQAVKKRGDEINRAYLDSLQAQRRIQEEADDLAARYFIDQQARLDREAQESAQLEAQRQQTRRAAEDILAAGDPLAQLELQLARESELLTMYAEQDAANAQLYADAKVALAQQTAERVAQIRDRELQEQAARDVQMLQLAGSAAGQLYGLMESAGRERTALGKALFAVEKALAIAQIILNTEVGATAALKLGPAGIPLAALIRTQGYMSAGIAAGVAIGQIAGGRQYGGPVEAGSLYRINEGGRPEMFTAANGSQYMLPTKSGQVTAAHKVGGGGPSFTYAPVIHVNGDVSAQTIQAMRAEIAADRTRWMRQMSLRGSA